jgi:hypothetical protein
MTEGIAVVAVLIVALSALAAMGAFMRSRERSWDRREHTWAAERRDLLDRIMYLTNHTWTAPPVDTQEERPMVPDYPPTDEVIYDPLQRVPHEVV